MSRSLNGLDSSSSVGLALLKPYNLGDIQDVQAARVNLGFTGNIPSNYTTGSNDATPNTLVAYDSNGLINCTDIVATNTCNALTLNATNLNVENATLLNIASQTIKLTQQSLNIVDYNNTPIISFDTSRNVSIPKSLSIGDAIPPLSNNLNSTTCYIDNFSLAFFFTAQTIWEGATTTKSFRVSINIPAGEYTVTSFISYITDTYYWYVNSPTIGLNNTSAQLLNGIDYPLFTVQVNANTTNFSFSMVVNVVGLWNSGPKTYPIYSLTTVLTSSVPFRYTSSTIMTPQSTSFIFSDDLDPIFFNTWAYLPDNGVYTPKLVTNLIQLQNDDTNMSIQNTSGTTLINFTPLDGVIVPNNVTCNNLVTPSISMIPSLVTSNPLVVNNRLGSAKISIDSLTCNITANANIICNNISGNGSGLTNITATQASKLFNASYIGWNLDTGSSGSLIPSSSSNGFVYYTNGIFNPSSLFALPPSINNFKVIVPVSGFYSISARFRISASSAGTVTCSVSVKRNILTDNTTIETMSEEYPGSTSASNGRNNCLLNCYVMLNLGDDLVVVYTKTNCSLQPLSWSGHLIAQTA